MKFIFPNLDCDRKIRTDFPFVLVINPTPGPVIYSDNLLASENWIIWY